RPGASGWAARGRGADPRSVAPRSGGDQYLRADHDAEPRAPGASGCASRRRGGGADLARAGVRTPARRRASDDRPGVLLTLGVQFRASTKLNIINRKVPLSRKLKIQAASCGKNSIKLPQ